MKILIFINPLAGSISAPTLEKTIIEELSHFPAKFKDHVDIRSDLTIAALEQLISEHQHELNRVIAAGGDGTITQVIAAMLPYPHILLGIIPVGTGNRLANNLGIPGHVKGALEIALNGSPYAIDIGKINDRYFSLMAGAGLDADIMAQVLPFEKRTMGVLAYFWRALQTVFWAKYAIFDIEADGIHYRTRGIGVVVANAGNLLGPYFTLTPGAKSDDGLFDVCVLGSRRRSDYWAVLIQILAQQHRGMEKDGVKHIKAKHIVIKSRPVLKVQADGDVIGTTPIIIEALPQAIQVMTPRAKNTLQPLSDSIQAVTSHLKHVIIDLFAKH